MHPKDISQAYDASQLTFALLRALGWTLQLNLGMHRPWHYLMSPTRLDLAQERLTYRSLALLKASKNERMIDVGCGRGKSSYLMAMSSSSEVVGIDYLDEAIEAAKTLYSNTPRLRFENADATQLPFPDASFNGLHCLEAAFHFDRRRFLHEARRVLVPGGRAVVVDFMWRDAACRAVHDTEEFKFIRHTWSFADFSTIDEYRAMAIDVGFDIAQCLDWTAAVTGALQRRFRAITQLGHSRLTRRILCRLIPTLRAFDDGDWRALADSERAHRRIQRLSRYVALVLVAKAEK